MVGKFIIGDRVTEESSNTIGEIVEICLSHSHVYYKVSYFDNGRKIISGYVPEFRLYPVQLNLF